ncbi:unnamed protein product [Trichobilharzia szidati]|nr:unnamed protein product [Trichobilharzia szidati]
MKYLYNYLATPDDKHPFFRAKMAFLTSYSVSFVIAGGSYLYAFTFGRNLTQAGVKCIEYILTGAAAGLGHSSTSLISAKATGVSDGLFNHAVGGAVSGLICTWKYSRGTRMSACAGFLIASVVAKAYVQFFEKYPDFVVPLVGERYPLPYATLNHRWMNWQAKQQEEELEKHV